MVRHEINCGPITITYGQLEDDIGVFLTIRDERLAWSENAPEEVNDLVYEIGRGDGTGNILNVNTGIVGIEFSYKVRIDTMKVFMQRYGVPQAHIDEFCGK